MSSITQIDEGLTYEHLIPGTFVTLFGIIFSLVIHPICILIILAGIMIVMSKTGIEIDPARKRIRKYVSWGVFKTGDWNDLTQIIKVELRYNTHHTILTRPIYLNKGDTTAKTYDLILISDLGEEIEVNQFTKPSLAYKALETLKGISNYEIINHMEEMLESQRQRRRR